MSKVQLYVYDLSRGMAKSMSMMLTGKQIDGIWHTSVVAFGREIFFGQGILEARPGTTHHGQPIQVIECGTTEIDEGTYQEYIASLGEMYTADAYHLMDFNCNHFTADVVGFLTGGTIPSWISGLPAEFLSTPFGQAMKPQIDAMFKRTSTSEHHVTGRGISSSSTLPTPPTSGTSTPSPLASNLLQSVATQATSADPSTLTPAPTPPTPETSTLIAVSSSSHFNSILSQHPAVVVNFTNTPGCPPCRAIKPAYEALAADCASTYGLKGARFVEIELGVGEGRDIAGRYSVRATPTFMFFKDGKKVDELKGASKRELETRVEEFFESVWPRHPHRKVYLPSVEHISLSPITSSALPNFTGLLTKLESFGSTSAQITVLKSKVIPLLEGKITPPDTELGQIMDLFMRGSASMASKLSPMNTFPLIDLWRVALLNPRICAWIALQLSQAKPQDPLSPFLSLTAKEVKSQGAATPKPLLLTTLRLLTNILASLPLANTFLSGSVTARQTGCMTIIVESLLHSEVGVRSAAAGVAVNLASWRHRLAKETKTSPEDATSHEWEVEIISAVVEGIDRETDPDIIHRLLVALALMMYLSPSYEEDVKPLLDVLSARETINNKLKTIKDKDVRKLGDEVTGKLYGEAS